MMSPACPPGFNSVAQECSDLDECQANEDNPDEDEICGENTQCFNTNGSFYCQCLEGFLSSQNSVNFSADSAAVCRDIDECNDSPGLCGTDAECFNTAPGYSCICDSGFISSTGVEKFHHSDGVTCTGQLSVSTDKPASADGFLSGMKPKPDQTFKLNSKIVTVTVSNNDTSQLSEPIKLTFYHLKQSNELNHVCVFWDSSEEGGTWSPRGCSTVDSNSEYTVCSCSHLSSFAVLMALYQMEDHFELQMMTFWGLSLSLICLFVCILTFSMIRSIQSPRTTIHLHLCISLFLAFLIFLTSISQTKSQVGCAVVAGLLHFFYLAAFCWMCLEGIQLFRMVVLVFNTNFKTLYMMLGGYGVPAVIVGVFALVHPKGYGTKRYCWLNLDFIWSFFGPVCVIITINIFFFIITVWKLAQKFSSLNPDLNSLAFVITAVAQLCVLGTMWIFGCFQFGENTIIMSYLFTIFGSLQGVMLFVMHCLFSKQVREEYVNILSRLCAPRKRSYTEYKFSSSSKANVRILYFIM
uniref:CD97 antigen-like n=1 Tax=Takifugu rubripes TaxID=31033 RepID=A0A674N1I0_TAKRU